MFVEAAGIGVLFPLLARVQEVHHLPTYSLGLMSGASFFAALVTQLGLSPFLDGRRARLVLIVGMILGCAAPLWFAFGGSLWSLTVSRALGGIAAGIVVPAALRSGTAGIEDDRRGARLGLLSSTQMAGIVLGPVLAVGLYDLGGIRLPFEAIAVAGAVLLVMVALSPGAGAVAAPTLAVANLRDSHDATEEASGRSKRGFSLTSPGVIAVLLIAAAAQIPNGFYDALWSRLLTDRGASTLLIGLSLTLFGIPFVILAPLGGKLAGRRNPLAWAVVGLVVSTGFMASYGFVDSPIVIIALGMFEACAQAIAVPGGYAAAAAVFPDRSAATGQGWVQGTGTAAAGAAAVAAAPMYGAFGSGPVFAAGAALSASLALVAYAVSRRSSGSDHKALILSAEPALVEFETP